MSSEVTPPTMPERKRAPKGSTLHKPGEKIKGADGGIIDGGGRVIDPTAVTRRLAVVGTGDATPLAERVSGNPEIRKSLARAAGRASRNPYKGQPHLPKDPKPNSLLSMEWG